MSIIRKLRWKLADRFPALDNKAMYYKPPARFEADKPKAHGWDAVLLGMASLVLIAVGLFGLFVACFVLWAMISS